MKKYYYLFFSILLLNSCEKKEFKTLKEHLNTSVKFEKKQVIDGKLDFTISIPKNYNFKIRENLSENIILSLDITSTKFENDQQCLISIQKKKGHKQNISLKDEFKHCIHIVRDFFNVEVLESGISNALKYESYFLHTKPNTKKFGKSEFMMFLIESDEKNIFYEISINSPLEKNLESNMAKLVQCLKSFKKTS